MIWQATASGEFSVRSAYYLEMEQSAEKGGEGSKKSGFSSLWKTIWDLKVPNNTKVFIWRACNNILPTKENLQCRGVLNDMTCDLRTREDETALHALWHCPAAQDVWAACGKTSKRAPVW